MNPRRREACGVLAPASGERVPEMALTDDERRRLAAAFGEIDLTALQAAEEATLAAASRRAGLGVSVDQLTQLVAPESRHELARASGQGPAPAALAIFEATEALERLLRAYFGLPSAPLGEGRAELARVRGLLSDLAGDFPDGVGGAALDAARAYLAEHPGEATP
jgi:hypothetical protein